MNSAPLLPGIGGAPSGDGRQVTLKGEVVGVTFSNEDTGFAVLRVSPSPNTIHYAVGPLAHIKPGEQVSLAGRWVIDTRHGRQFKVDVARAQRPSTLEGLKRYLSSGLVPGVGEGLATRLVETLGEDLPRALGGDVPALCQVKGLGKRRAQALVDAWEEAGASREAMIFLESLEIGRALAQLIHRAYGSEAPEKVRTAPYQMIEDIKGVGFIRADAIAKAVGVPPDSVERGQAGLWHCLQRGRDRGHTCLPEESLIHQALALDIPKEPLMAGLAELLRRGKVISEEGEGGPFYFLEPLHRYEVEVAQGLLSWPLPQATPGSVEGALQEAESHLGHPLGEDQARALAMALEEPILVITGGPGTGKTTLVRALTALFSSIPGGMALAAPTGRAAKRLSEVTGREAKTLHRLLEIRPGSFGRRNKPLEAGAVLVDESSMIDLPLFAALLRGLKRGCRLILLGDADQLPPVGPGEVFRDLVDTEALPVARLKTLYRQDSASFIATNAHRMIRGEMPVLPQGAEAKSADFFYLETAIDDVPRVVVDLVTQRLPKAYGLDGTADIQVLAPSHRGGAGVANLNRLLQGRLQGLEASAEGEAPSLKPGDKVLQTRNNYDHDLFNGDIGTLISLKEGTGEVDFDGRRLTLEGKELRDLELAYALTVHKSQGSEYPAVVVPIVPHHLALLDRSLLYTAVTRARRLLVLVGHRGALMKALQKSEGGRRHTRLAHRLSQGRP